MKKILLIIGISCLAFSYTPNEGRVLAAANCFQCHGTNGISVTKWDSIKDEDVKDFYDDHPIMHAQTFGFNRNEVREIFNYLHSIKSNYYKNKKEYEDYEEDEYYKKKKHDDYEKKYYKNSRYHDDD